MKNLYKILARKTGRNGQLYKRSHRWECTVKWIDPKGDWRNFGFHKRQFNLSTRISTLIMPIALIHARSTDLGSRHVFILPFHLEIKLFISSFTLYEGWNFNSGNYLFTTDTK